jgi:hypothetical protein
MSNSSETTRGRDVICASDGGFSPDSRSLGMLMFRHGFSKHHRLFSLMPAHPAERCPDRNGPRSRPWVVIKIDAHPITLISLTWLAWVGAFDGDKDRVSLTVFEERLREVVGSEPPSSSPSGWQQICKIMETSMAGWRQARFGRWQQLLCA